MKKIIAMVLTLAISMGMFAGCAGVPVVMEQQTGKEEEGLAAVTGQGAVKTGLSVITNMSAQEASFEADGTVTTDISLVGVLVNDSGVIEACAIDAIQGKVSFDQEGQLVMEPGEILSKNELGDDYGMRAASPIGKEWNEQAAFIAQYAVGKTLEELKTKAIDEAGMVKDADLASGATVYMGSFIWAIEDAINNAKYYGAGSGDRLILTDVSTSLGSESATLQKDGSAVVNSNVTVMTMDGDKISSCIIDAVSTKAAFKADGTLAEEVTKNVLSKAQLGENYGLKAYSSIGKEWDQQTLAFCEYITGKTIEEVKGISLTETTAPADADLSASVSIAIGDFMQLVEKAAK